MTAHAKGARAASRAEQLLDPVVLLCQAYDLPLPEREVEFHPVRHWRADYLWRAPRVIVEVDGGLFRGGKGGGFAVGGHSSARGILRDMEKANAAQLHGYRVFRVTPQQATDGTLLAILQQVL